MDKTRALEIIDSLAAGIDPFSGEILPENSTLQHPDVVRALFTAKFALQVTRKAQKQPAPKDPNLPTHAGNSWSEEEDRQLVSAFESGNAVKELALKHQRTDGAIRSRLIKLGKLELPYK
ncbi:MAG: hypothetical protein ABL877_12560 [Thiobacillus sp.]